MNHRRIAALLRALADEFDFDALEQEQQAKPKPVEIPIPPGGIDEVAMQRMRTKLRSLGMLGSAPQPPRRRRKVPT